SGKTQAALWHLSMRDIDRRPWIVYNWKRDMSIDSIPHKRDIELDEIPVKPGVYVSHPHPNQAEEVEAQMWAIWERGETGVYIDEGYMLGRNSASFRALLTQGRSLHVPMIVLSQRPVWLDLFVFSESDFIQVFHLQHKRDGKNVQEFVPIDPEKRLPQYYSYY